MGLDDRSSFQPPQELIDILLPAFGPCSGFNGVCRGSVVWNPALGHVPRGFRAGTGRIDEIKLVLVCAEPGDPYEDEHCDGRTALDRLLSTYRSSCWHLEEPRDRFGRNLQEILRIAFPMLSLSERMKRTWVTESVLCSAAEECGPVPRAVEAECRDRYLLAQLRLLSSARIVALGAKAWRRLRGLPGVRFAAAAAPPEGNKPRAKMSWLRALEGLEP